MSPSVALLPRREHHTSMKNIFYNNSDIIEMKRLELYLYKKWM